MEPVLKIETEGSVRILTLNRPECLNALNTPLFDALASALASVESEESVRAVLLTGAGRGFCAGADLSQSIGPTVSLGALVERFYNPLVRQMRALPKPIVVAVNGVAAGAGVNIALAGDIVVAARSANFTQAFVRIGLLPDAGGTYFLPRLIGEARARALAMLGETISAVDAERFGLIWKLFDDEVMIRDALALATNLGAKPKQSLSAIKQAITVSLTNSFDAQLDLERDLQEMLGRSADFAEGVAAFKEKRPPRFSGGLIA